MSDPVTYALRPATAADVDDLLALLEATGDGPPVRWTREQLLEHMSLFPEGQMVVDWGEQLVAASSALITTLGRDPYRDHTWAGVTDGGWFRSHDPFRTTLYVAHLAVHPQHRGKGLGRLLCEAQLELCKRLDLQRVLVPGRMFDYLRRAEEMSLDEYARQVEDGELSDPVLSFLLHLGFVFQKVVRSYREDDRSGDAIALMQWSNPGYRPRARKPRSIRVSCVQYRMRKISDFDDFARYVRYFVDVSAGYGSDFVVFPELLTAQLMSFIEVKTALEAVRRLTTFTEQVDELFRDLAVEFQVGIVGGTHPIRRDDDRIENVASLYLPSGTIHRQPKLHVTPNEARNWGIAGGNSLQVFHTPKAKVGILVCYDVEFPEAARYLADQGAHLIFVPFCTDDRQSYLRVRYCAQARAVENQVYLALAGNVGNLPDTENMDIQYAQSAVFCPSDFLFARDGIQVEAGVNTETVITTDLDLEALEEAWSEGTVKPRRDRRRDLFDLTTYLQNPPA